jgi:hypothetical protein
VTDWWADSAAWASAVGTVSATAAALYVALRGWRDAAAERADREAAQARLIVMEKDSGTSFKITNLAAVAGGLVLTVARGIPAAARASVTAARLATATAATRAIRVNCDANPFDVGTGTMEAPHSIGMGFWGCTSTSPPITSVPRTSVAENTTYTTLQPSAAYPWTPPTRLSAGKAHAGTAGASGSPQP